MELKEALSIALQAGYTIERQRVHLYKNRYDKFAVLAFGKGSEIKNDEEFDDPNKAAERYLELVAPGE